MAALADLPPYSVVVFFCAQKADKRRKLYKRIAKIGVIVEVNPLRAWELKDWLRPHLRELGREFAPQAEEYFLSLAGVMDTISLGYLEQELEKILLYTKKNRIELADVQATMASCPAVSVFAMLDAIGEKDLKKSVQLLNDQLNAGEHPLKLLTLLTRHLRQLWQARVLARQKMTGRAVAQALGVVPFIAEKLSRQSQNFTEEKLKRTLSDFDECDYLFKSGQADPVRLEALLVALCR